ncbi:MAG: hypothetical protein LBV21_01580 [Candidatus Adiutrix sp.]|nr:hypothetical protein [Candidatus Adiutrix sp.]
MSRIKLEGDSLVIDGQSFDARRPLNSSSMLPTPALKRLLQLDPLISEQDRPAYLDLVQRLTERRNEYARRNYHPSLLDQNGELSNAALRDIKTQVGFALRKFVDRLGPWVWGLRGDLMTSALKAAQNWKPEGGAQLKTYLHKPLEGALQDLTNPHLKQLPRALHPLLYKHWGEIMSPSGVTDQELATSLNTTPEAIRQVRDYFRMTRPQAMTQVSEGEEFDTKAVQGYAGDN